MTSAKFEFYVLFVRKFGVFFDPLPPLCADVIYGSPLTKMLQFHDCLLISFNLRLLMVLKTSSLSLATPSSAFSDSMLLATKAALAASTWRQL